MLRNWMNKYNGHLLFASDNTLRQLLQEANYFLDEKEITDPIPDASQIESFRENIYREMHKRKYKFCMRQLQVLFDYTDRFAKIAEWAQNLPNYQLPAETPHQFPPGETVDPETENEDDSDSSTLKLTQVEYHTDTDEAIDVEELESDSSDDTD